MMFGGCKKALTVLMTCMLALLISAPSIAFAAESEVEVENHSYGQETVSKIVIDDVDAPKAGQPLDDKAVVSTAEGKSWDIPVLWVSDALELATQAEEDTSYLPVLAFYVPNDYAVEGSSYQVTLSDSLTKLFGGKEVISVYDESTGVTFILPASLRDFFFPKQEQSGLSADDSALYEQYASDQDATSEDGPQSPSRTLVDIYCSQTARDALTDDDLEFLIDLILNKLQPQAVELLLDSFPAFRAAADQGEIGTQIGLYIYFEKGDQDGRPEHEWSQPNALAFVYADPVLVGDEVQYRYMIGVDAKSLVKVDKDNNPVINPATGKYQIDRDGDAMRTFENTMVHETFHALMDDYNRTGMAGAKDLRNVLTDEDGNITDEKLVELYNTIHFPQWFIEGTASMVENVYQFRYDDFTLLRADSSQPSGYDPAHGAFTRRLLENYINGEKDGKPLYYDLRFARGYDDDNNPLSSDDVVNSRYLSGYLASLFLGEMAARVDDSIGTSITTSNDQLSISSGNIRMGLNNILERMHNGETLDQVIYDISPVDDAGKKCYTSTDDFQLKFIKGVHTVNEEGGKTYYGDKGNGCSFNFVATFLDYLLDLELAGGREYKPNGSAIFAFDEDFETPLDCNKESSSDFLQIVESNELVESTVPNSTALAGGGKSDPDAAVAAAASSEPGLQASEDAPVVVDDVTDDCTAVADDEIAAVVDDSPAEVIDVQPNVVEPVDSAYVDVAEPADVEPADVVEPEPTPEAEPVAEPEELNAAA
ncbi:MAG: hypothetical protein IKE22_10260 [Atopobiaceae bacterium]|nr:hypothetical protein [Atopobiaceae bacterium]